MSRQVGKARRLPAVTEAEEDHSQAHQDHHDNGGDLDHGKPELQLTVQAHRRQVG
ncbi:hypothetical protein D3C76_1810550 [compost metagenome]